MQNNKITIKRALLSVSNKEGIVAFAKKLVALNIEIISTGGTSQILREAHIPVKDVSDLTQFPEIMDGRVKTLHPKIHGGILGRRDQHADVAEQHTIQWIDLVVVNLYPFAETIRKPQVTFAEAIENIDIGGPTMIRSAAKNMEWVAVVVDPNDYQFIVSELEQEQGLQANTRKQLATKAFAHTAQYDALIHRYLAPDRFPAELNLHLEKITDLRYGENPQQAAAAYRFGSQTAGVMAAKQHQGKQLSYNNLMDGDAALSCLREFSEPACVIVKHANPCGVAIAQDISRAFTHAFNADALSAFGGIVALNRPCTQAVAEAMDKLFIEVLLAPAFDANALSILSRKTNLRVLEYSASEKSLFKEELRYEEIRYIEGGLLIQEVDRSIITLDQLQCVTERKPTAEESNAMLFAWRVLKHIKSNAILIAKGNTTQGVGAGQVSRVDAVRLAIDKAGPDLVGTVLASDAFFPFRDSIDHIAEAGIKAIIQPGGSVRDSDVIQACNENNIAMALTGLRCFKH